MSDAVTKLLDEADALAAMVPDWPAAPNPLCVNCDGTGGCVPSGHESEPGPWECGACWQSQRRAVNESRAALVPKLSAMVREMRAALEMQNAATGLLPSVLAALRRVEAIANGETT